jgi:hypothetical protein
MPDSLQREIDKSAEVTAQFDALRAALTKRDY